MIQLSSNTAFLLVNKGSIYQTYLKVGLLISSFLALHTNLYLALEVFALAVVLDTITRIHATGKNSGIPFDPKRKEFWLLIKSKGIRNMFNKVFMQYGIYALIAYFLDKNLLNQMTIFTFRDQPFTLPVVAVWLFTGSEIWSIGENIEDAGGVNYPKRLIHLIDEKYQKIFKKNSDE